MFQRTEKCVPKQLVDGVGSRKVEQVNEIVPSWIQEDDMLCHVIRLAVEIEESIDRPDFKIPPPEGRQTCLQFDPHVLWEQMSDRGELRQN